MNRLKVPIYYTSSFSIGYDSNLFRLSDLDLEVDNNNTIINSDTFDSGYITPKLQVSYSPYLLNGIKTEFNVSFSRNHYFSSEEKSYNTFSSDLGLKLGSYQWIKISHRFTPKYYLRNYFDHDYSYFDNKVCTFSIENLSMSYSHPITNRSWSRVKISQTNFLYNSHFTEYDTRISLIELRHYFKLLKFSNNVWYSYSNGNNISYDSGYFSTSVDRSYYEHNIGLSGKIKGKDIIKSNSIHYFGFSLILKNRIYKSETEIEDVIDSWQYESHNGREHIETNISFWIDAKINNQITNQIKFKYRIRDVESDYTWITDYKNFNKYEIIYKISINSDLNLLY